MKKMILAAVMATLVMAGMPVVSFHAAE